MRIPTITDPRGTDFAAASRLKQQSWMVALERRARYGGSYLVRVSLAQTAM